MQFIKAELQLVEERNGGKFGFDDNDKTEGRRIMDKKLAKHTEAVAKLHESLENKIMARHNELQIKLKKSRSSYEYYPGDIKNTRMHLVYNFLNKYLIF